MAGYRRQNTNWQLDDDSRSAARERLAARQRSAGREMPGETRETPMREARDRGSRADHSEGAFGPLPWSPSTGGSRGRATGFGGGAGGFDPRQALGGIMDAVSDAGAGIGANLDRIRMYAIGAAAVVGVVLLALAVFFIMPVGITVDGKELQVSRMTTYQGLVDQGALESQPGNLLAVDGELLEEGKGNPPAVFVGDVQVDLGSMVAEGAEIRSEQGSDATEPYSATQETIPIETRIARDLESEAMGADPTKFNFYNGVLHIVTDKGQEGIKETRTGEISGKTATVDAQEMKPRVVENIHPVLPDDQKLIALTFDDGPSPLANETLDVLAVLEKYDAKGTFFMLGTEAEEYPEIAKQVADAGHQVCSHSYSHEAEHFLNNTTEDDVRFQVSKAREVIEAATGIDPMYIRPPGGNVDVKAIEAAGDLADGYIGWSIDPHDYELPGSDAIAQSIISQASPGAVVLLHDGGGDRAQTVEALNKAIPQLQKQGYEFVTLDVLIEAILASKN